MLQGMQDGQRCLCQLYTVPAPGYFPLDPSYSPYAITSRIWAHNWSYWLHLNPRIWLLVLLSKKLTTCFINCPGYFTGKGHTLTKWKVDCCPEPSIFLKATVILKIAIRKENGLEVQSTQASRDSPLMDLNIWYGRMVARWGYLLVRSIIAFLKPNSDKTQKQNRKRNNLRPFVILHRLDPLSYPGLATQPCSWTVYLSFELSSVTFHATLGHRSLPLYRALW